MMPNIRLEKIDQMEKIVDQKQSFYLSIFLGNIFTLALKPFWLLDIKLYRPICMNFPFSSSVILKTRSILTFFSSDSATHNPETKWPFVKFPWVKGSPSGVSLMVEFSFSLPARGFILCFNFWCLLTQDFRVFNLWHQLSRAPRKFCLYFSLMRDFSLGSLVEEENAVRTGLEGKV